MIRGGEGGVIERGGVLTFLPSKGGANLREGHI